jgi:hypothetical protein
MYNNTHTGQASYTNKFSYEVPKKQAKSYEIDMGQNV